MPCELESVEAREHRALRPVFQDVDDSIGGSAMTSQEPQRITPALRQLVVLVAEADPVMRRLLVITLRHDGFSVLDASTGAELDDWVRSLIVHDHESRCVQLVISEQHMPSVTGLEVLAHVRSVDSATPFILLTAAGDRATRAEAMRLGASCVLDKPFDLEDFRTAALKYAMTNVSKPVA